MAVAVATFAVAAALALRAAGVWDATSTELAVLGVALAALAMGSSLGAAVGEYHTQRSAERRAKVAYLLEALGWAIQDATGIDLRDLGLAAYVIDRPLLRRQQRLRRLHRLRPRATPGVSGVTWRPGKGVIGMCVVEGRDIGYDVSALDRDLEGVSAAEWAQLAADDRLGLSYEEWLLLREKFAVVVATPIVREHSGRARTIGCVAVDGPAGKLDALFSDEVRIEMQSAATSLERVVL